MRMEDLQVKPGKMEIPQGAYKQQMFDIMVECL